MSICICKLMNRKKKKYNMHTFTLFVTYAKNVKMSV